MSTSEALTNDIRTEANTALLEVDKGLRSTRVGEQCEAIVKFPSLMDRFPFPILINSAFLKLADVFRIGTNLLRFNTLKVVQLSERHLNKITNVDEFLRRIHSVTHSNDPVARAITLRVYGAIASIVAERKNVHHSIHRGLDSNDQVEVEGAIFAVSSLCQYSASFATGVCEKISGMVQGLTTPVEMKLRLIPILTQMHHDLNTATQVRELCLKLLPSYPSLSLVTTTLHTLTKLAVATLVHATQQVILLLDYAQSDARRAVRFAALRELHSLATAVPHTWTPELLQGLLGVIEGASRPSEKELGCLVLLKLSDSTAVHNMTALRDSLQAFCYSSNSTVAAYALGVVTNITMATATGEGVEVGGMLVDQLLTLDLRSGQPRVPPFKVMLVSLEKLATSADVCVAALDRLLTLLPLLSGVQAGLVCKALVSLSMHTPGAWDHVTPRLLGYLEDKKDYHHEILLPVTAVLMQLHAGVCGAPQRSSFTHSTLSHLLSHVWDCQHPSQLWLAYKVARRASMMGFHSLAEPIYLKLSKLVSSVKFRNWLSSLYQFSVAQNLISSTSTLPSSSSPHHTLPTTTSLTPALCKASSLVCDAILLVKASGLSSSFPLRFLCVHATWLDAHCQLLATCVGYHTVPSPTSSLGSSSLEKKFKLCTVQFQSLGQEFSALYSALFDADPATLEYITLLQQSCLLMASVISSVALSKKPLVSPGRVSTPMAETPALPVEISDNFNTNYLLGKACKDTLQHAQTAASALQSLPISEEHASVLSECSKMILQVPLRLPQYFFISLQQTTVKLALSPSVPASGQPVSVTLGTHLALRVEGVIQHCSKSKVCRSATAVHVQVTQEIEKSLSSDAKSPGPVVLDRTEPVENDYFQAPFLLTHAVAGYYKVVIEANLVDHTGSVWRAGHQREVMVLLVDSEDNLKRQLRQREMASKSMQSAAGSSSHRSA